MATSDGVGVDGVGVDGVDGVGDCVDVAFFFNPEITRTHTFSCSRKQKKWFEEGTIDLDSAKNTTFVMVECTLCGSKKSPFRIIGSPFVGLHYVLCTHCVPALRLTMQTLLGPVLTLHERGDTRLWIQRITATGERRCFEKWFVASRNIPVLTCLRGILYLPMISHNDLRAEGFTSTNVRITDLDKWNKKMVDNPLYDPHNDPDMQ